MPPSSEITKYYNLVNRKLGDSIRADFDEQIRQLKNLRRRYPERYAWIGEKDSWLRELLAFGSFYRLFIGQFEGAAQFCTMIFETADVQTIQIGTKTLDARNVTEMRGISSEVRKLLAFPHLQPWMFQYSDVHSFLNVIRQQLGESLAQ